MTRGLKLIDSIISRDDRLSHLEPEMILYHVLEDGSEKRKDGRELYMLVGVSKINGGGLRRLSNGTYN